MNTMKTAFPVLMICFMMLVVACGCEKQSNSAEESVVTDNPTDEAIADKPAEELQWKPTETGEILIVNANVQEAFPEDIRVEDMSNFVKRMTKVLPNRPDILLLQEVLKDSAEQVSQFSDQSRRRTLSSRRRAGEGPNHREGSQFARRDQAGYGDSCSFGRVQGGGHRRIYQVKL